jgi:DNA repair protein RadA/Sms
LDEVRAHIRPSPITYNGAARENDSLAPEILPGGPLRTAGSRVGWFTMTKTTVTFLCRECGGESVRWAGQCPHCRAWNTLEEFTVRGAKSGGGARGRGAAGHAGDPAAGARPITEVDEAAAPRLRLDWDELNRVLGGGVVPGSLVLVSGEPGVGKSTLLMHLAHQVAQVHGPVLYASGEESAQQVRMRAVRLGALHEGLLILADNDLDHVIDEIHQRRPALAVVDSIQTIYDASVESGAGSVTQVREATARLLRTAKDTGIAVILVGHVTKDGAIAGPRVLEHMVDCVLYLEGERANDFRVLRSHKNRFGSADEIGMFAMGEAGMIEVHDPSGFLLEHRTLSAPGTVAVPVLEGSRPLLVELQSLVVPTSFGMPRRTANGYDINRLHMLIAVIEKRAGIKLSQSEVFVNVAGGMRVSETAADLGLALSIAGNARNTPLPESTVVLGEVGLAGEVRRVRQVERRLSEAVRRGFARAIVPRLAEGAPRPDGIDVIEVRDLADALETAFGPEGGRGRVAPTPVLTVSGGDERR